MQIVRTVQDLKAILAKQSKVVFVPTMGNLHDGHLALIREAKRHGGCLVTSIFVNRLQFAPHEDFDQYPRTLQADADKLSSVGGVEVVFAPAEHELYPEPQRFGVQVPDNLGKILEGACRPGFFEGVCTVLLKFFSLVRPDIAVFGKKDYQQLLIVRHLCRQFMLPTQIIGVETMRSGEGLALSSRNGYLSEHERQQAVQLHEALQGVKGAFEEGSRAFGELESQAAASLQRAGWKVDYVSVRRRADLSEPQEADQAGDFVVLAAARLGATRLIDNLEF